MGTTTSLVKNHFRVLLTSSAYLAITLGVSGCLSTDSAEFGDSVAGYSSATSSTTGAPTPAASGTIAAGPLTNRVVMVGYGGRRMATLDGGASWIQNQVDIPDGGDDTYNLRSVAYGNGLFVAIGNRVMTSPDGVNWTTTVTDAELGNWMGGIVYVNSMWVMVGGCGVRAYSSDAKNWTFSQGIGSCTHLRQLAYGNGVFFSVGDSAQEAVSVDGINWTLPVDPNGATYNSNGGNLIFANNRFYALTSSNQAVQTQVVVKPTGTQSAWTPTWSPVTNLPSENFGAISLNNGTLYFSATNALYSSTNGSTWNTINTSVNSPIIAQGGAYLTYAWDSLSRSTDLINWSPISNANPSMATNPLNAFVVFTP